jgi:phosphoserine aminotransferase
MMNVAFNLPNPEMEKRFLAEAAAAGFSGLSGHRAIGGIRASIYNALSIPAVEKLVGFMEDFRSRQTTCNLQNGFPLGARSSPMHVQPPVF